MFKSNTENKWYMLIDEFGGRGYVPFETTGCTEWPTPDGPPIAGMVQMIDQVPAETRPHWMVSSSPCRPGASDARYVASSPLSDGGKDVGLGLEP